MIAPRARPSIARAPLRFNNRNNNNQNYSAMTVFAMMLSVLLLVFFLVWAGFARPIDNKKPHSRFILVP